jgi:hypothetical protein
MPNQLAPVIQTDLPDASTTWLPTVVNQSSLDGAVVGSTPHAQPPLLDELLPDEELDVELELLDELDELLDEELELLELEELEELLLEEDELELLELLELPLTVIGSEYCALRPALSVSVVFTVQLVRLDGRLLTVTVNTPPPILVRLPDRFTLFVSFTSYTADFMFDEFTVVLWVPI